MLLLPGVGRYTAHSVLIFADNADYVTVDTNIRRIFIHELGVSPDCSEDELYNIASKVLPRGRSRDWHNGLMDYGALVATSRNTGIAALSKQKPFKGSVREARGKY